jgi:hypothetical protein
VTYDREILVQTLIAHQRHSARFCLCGFGKLGASHPEHVADAYEAAVKGSPRPVVDRVVGGGI